MRVWLALFILLAINRVEAAETESVVSLFEGTSQEGKIDVPEEKKEDSGIFSFLNFGKIKTEAPKITVADEKRLSPFEQSVKLADGGDVNAQLLVGYSYLYGQNGASVDYGKAFEYYAKAAMQNDSVGLNNLGSLYYSGVGVTRNTAKAAILFEKSAELGNAEAAVNLAFILISGNGVEKNAAEAMDLFEKAAAADNVSAHFMYGYALYTGKLRAQNFAAAAPHVRKAADAGFDEAQYVVALMYINGLGFPPQLVRWLKRQGWSAERFFYDEQKIRELANIASLEENVESNRKLLKKLEKDAASGANLKNIITRQEEQLKLARVNPQELELIKANLYQVNMIMDGKAVLKN